MITLNARQVYLINQINPEAFLCISIKDIHLTTFYHDLIVGTDTYLSTNLIEEVDSPQMVSNLERDLYTVKITDSNNVFHTTLSEGYYGAPSTVYLGFIDSSTGQPDVDNMLLIYDGIFESYSKSFDLSEVGAATCKLVFANLMSALDASSPYYTSKEYVNGIAPGDTSFDQINEGTGVVNLKWGKK